MAHLGLMVVAMFVSQNRYSNDNMQKYLILFLTLKSGFLTAVCRCGNTFGQQMKQWFGGGGVVGGVTWNKTLDFWALIIKNNLSDTICQNLARFFY